MKKRSLFIVLSIILIPVIYLTFVYNSLPAQVATHFSIDGKPNDYSSRSTLVWLVIFLMAVAMGVYMLLTNIEKIDPKKAAGQSKETMQKIGLAIVVLTSAIAVIMIYAAVNNGFSFNKVMLPLMGLFFAYLGNLMYSVKPNYFVGIRTPWALEDADTWRKTHQLAGKLWFVGGIIITIITLLAPAKPAFIVMASVTAIIIIIPAVYSYRYFSLHRK